MTNPYSPTVNIATETQNKPMKFGSLALRVVPFSAILSIIGPLLIVSFFAYEQIGLYWPEFLRFSLLYYVAPSIVASAIAIVLGWYAAPFVCRFYTREAFLLFGIIAVCTEVLLLGMLMLGILAGPLESSGWQSFRFSCIAVCFALTLGLAATLKREE